MALVLTWPVGRDVKITGENRGLPPIAPPIAYVVAATLGGTITGAAVGALGVSLRSGLGNFSGALTGGAVTIALVAIVLQWQGKLAPLPERRAQVPRHWLLWRRPALTAAAFGLMIGAGVLTHLRYASAYVLGALLLIAPSVAVASALGGLYGASRGLKLLETWLGDRYLQRSDDPAEGRRYFRLGDRAMAIIAVGCLGLAVLITS
jgi:hypothetical protein